MLLKISKNMKLFNLFEKIHDLCISFFVGSYYLTYGYIIFFLGYLFSKKIWGIKDSVYSPEGILPKLDRGNWHYYSKLNKPYKMIGRNSKSITFLPFLVILYLIKSILF